MTATAVTACGALATVAAAIQTRCVARSGVEMTEDPGKLVGAVEDGALGGRGSQPS